MRTIPPALAAELSSGVTTLCRCWRAVRRDGASFGFTDHDRDIAFGGVTFQASSGLEASEAESLLGLAVGGGEIAGALQADVIRDSDIDAGLWDGAGVETWLVDWRDVSRRMLLDAGRIGEIRRQGASFTAEVRSLAQSLDQERGRRYGRACDAEFGDARCGADLSIPGRRSAAVIAAVIDPTSFTIAGPAGSSPGDFTGGLAAISGASAPIMSHTRIGAFDSISLWSPPPRPLLAGASVTLTAGCDKRFATCRDRFGNALNFRGFPHIPGNDFVTGYVRQGEPGLDGGALVS